MGGLTQREDPPGEADSPKEEEIPLRVAMLVMGGLLVGGGAMIGYFLYRPAGEAKVMRAVVPSPGMPRVVGGSQGAPNAATVAAVRGVVEDEQLPDGVHERPGGEVL